MDRNDTTQLHRHHRFQAEHSIPFSKARSTETPASEILKLGTSKPPKLLHYATGCISPTTRNSHRGREADHGGAPVKRFLRKAALEDGGTVAKVLGSFHQRLLLEAGVGSVCFPGFVGARQAVVLLDGDLTVLIALRLHGGLLQAPMTPLFSSPLSSM
jgi:hypothetical protein